MINIDHGYVHTQDDFHFVEGIFDLCRAAKQLNCLIFVVTNQAGIGRGHYTENDFLALTDWMCGVFSKEGAPIDKVYFCPTHPELGIGKYKTESLFRKPGPGMILQAAEEFDVDLGCSVLVGDKETDIDAGRASKVGRNLLYYPNHSLAPIKTSAHAVVEHFKQAIPFLGHA